MILFKSKFSIVTNILYVLMASTLSLLVFYDVSELFGFAPVYALVFFAVCALLGLLLYKLLSYTSTLDFLKSFSDKGKYISVVIFTFTMLASVCFRCLTYMWSGLGGNAYFEIAKVTGNTVPHYVHPADEFYVQVLHAVFFLFGNRIYVAAIINCILQLFAVCFGFIGFRKLLGNVPALCFAFFWTVSGFSVHEALTLNSRTISFFFIMAAVFALSFAVPAKEGKMVSCILSGIMIALSIYVDITGFVLLPFLAGMMFFVKGNEDSAFSLRAFKTLLTFLSSVAGFVIIVIVDGIVSSSNPIHVIGAIFSRYFPADDFTLGFSYMTSYTEIFIMAIIVSLGVFITFFSDDDTKAVLIFSTIIILLINNFGLYYLENDGRCLLYTFCALFTGISLRELFPAVFTGDLFKGGAEIDNDVSYPDEGYVPQGLSPDEMTLPEEVSLDIPASSPAQAPAPQTAPAPANASSDNDPKAGNDNSYDLGSFDAIKIPAPGGSVSGSSVSGSADTGKKQEDIPLTGLALSESSKAPEKKEEPSEKPAEKSSSGTGAYVYKKPQLKPEYRRMPGQWARENAKKQEEKNKENINENKKESIKEDSKDNSKELNKEAVKAETAVTAPSPRVDENGVVLLDNPIPHPVRKTEHKEMEFRTQLSPSESDYDIAVSDDDDFDV